MARRPAARKSAAKPGKRTSQPPAPRPDFQKAAGVRRRKQPTTTPQLETIAPASAPQPELAPMESAPQVADGKTTIRVRMYRQGLGDCFLVTLPARGGKTFRMLIDCGVILGTKEVVSLMQDVVRDIIAETHGFVDVLVVTHEHYDHVAGFVVADSLFARPEDTQTAGKLRVGETWFAWTEDPNDPLAKRLQTARQDRVQRLSGMVQRLQEPGMAASPLIQGVKELLGFFGVDGNKPGDARGEKIGATRAAMNNARAYGSRVTYHRPGEKPWTSDAVPDIRIWVLGPPQNESLLKRTFVADEVYHLACDDGPDQAFFLVPPLGAGTRLPDDESGDVYSPFDEAYSRYRLRSSDQSAVAASRAMPATMKDFLSRHYYNASPDPLDPDQSWRRIDEDWLGAAAQFALQLDAATNNTSLVLAIEVVSSGKVLLFAADAQVGNWESWQTLEWRLDEHTRVCGPDLLKRTVFYKVGHHGSHNATLREKGLELMPQGLVAFIPVDHAMAVKKHWGHMPVPGLIDALKDKAQSIVRVDEALQGQPGVVAAKKPFSKRFSPDGTIQENEPLYYEWSAALGR
jgi:hypothetical protein